MKIKTVKIYIRIKTGKYCCFNPFFVSFNNNNKNLASKIYLLNLIIIIFK